MNQEELKRKVDLHTLWLSGDPAGTRLDLREANLSEANLSEAYLGEAKGIEQG